MRCDACGEHVDEEKAVHGYLAPNSVLCPACYDYLDNEVFTARNNDDED
jgi:formylmethanofuran dehydrogenase subunit E